MASEAKRRERMLALRDNLATILDEVSHEFKEPKGVKITLLVRCPPFDGTRDVYLSDDKPEEVLRCIKELIERGESW
jgi:hypothetical protein